MKAQGGVGSHGGDVGGFEVPRHVLLEGRGVAALGALVWLFAGVRPHVHGQVALEGGSVGAVGARVRSLQVRHVTAGPANPRQKP